MSEIIHLLIHISIVSSLLILFIFMLRFVFKDKINTKLLYTLWLIVALRLLIPFSFQCTLETQKNLPQIPILDFIFENNEDSYERNKKEVTNNEEKHVSILESQAEKNNLPQSYLWDGYQFSINTNNQGYNILFIIWITGIFCVLVIFGIRNVSFHKKIMKSMMPYNFSDNSYNEAAKAAGFKHTVPVYLSKSLKSPCIIGIFNPVIVLTESIINDTEATKFALLHEMVHYKQRDNFFRLLGYILCALYWFNPLVWLSADAARNDAELSCDSRVIQKLRPSEHLNYCYTLLSIASNSNKTVTAMSTGGSKMKRRIDMILKPPKKQTSIIIAGVICILLGLMSFINISVRAENVSDVISLSEIHKVYQLLTSLQNPNDNYKINTIIINNTDEDMNTFNIGRSLYLRYEFSKNDSIAGINDDTVQRINAYARQLFSSIPDLDAVTISYIDKPANSIIRNTKAPITYIYRRNDIKKLNISPQIDNSFWQSKGNNNVIIVYGYSEFYSSMGIGESEYENSEIVSELFSKLGDYDDSWQSYESIIYRFSPNPFYKDWADFMIITDEIGNLEGHGIILSDLKY